MSIKRQKTKVTDVEVVPVFEYYSTGKQSEGERKMVGSQLLEFCRRMGTNHVVARNIAFPEGHPHWSQFVIVDIKKLEHDIEGLLDIDSLVQNERAKKMEQEEKRRKKNPKIADFEDQIKSEIEKGISEAHGEDYDGKA